jgi:hypothetical protein
MASSNDPMAAVRQYVDAFNSGDEQAMAAARADPMQILDGMSPHVWQGPTAAQTGGVTPVPKLSTLVLRAFTSVSVSHGTSMSLWRLWVRCCSRRVLVQPF